jgi:outer membrane receptor for ferrienterochelin and colicin
MMKTYAAFMRLVACCGMTYAQQPAGEQKKRSVVELFETVIVNADYERPEIPESPTTIAEVTAEQLQLRSVANIGQALELLPGVQFRVARAKNG